MTGVIVKVVLLLHFLQLIINVTGQDYRSPCPNYFQYVKDDNTGEVTGIIEIPLPPKNTVLKTVVSLSLNAALPTKYTGKLTLLDSPKLTYDAVMQGLPLKYRIHFPLHRPLPALTALQFNNAIICSGPAVIGPIVTSIKLQHTLYPPEYEPIGRPPPPPPPPTSEVHLDKNCGIQSELINLIVHGEVTKSGEWPWVVAIYYNAIDIQYRCAGTLVTNYHIITAAHCLRDDENTNIPIALLLAYLGAHKLYESRPKDMAQLSKYTISPDYKPGSGDADIAVLKMREKVEFRDRIHAICLWPNFESLDKVVGRTGYVVGWGRDESGQLFSPEPRKASATIVSQDDCTRTYAHFKEATSDRTFCAGNIINRSGPCRGDSGTGFVIRSNLTMRFYLRGVVSSSFKEEHSDNCDLSKYVIYVDVAKHLDWIREEFRN